MNVLSNISLNVEITAKVTVEEHIKSGEKKIIYVATWKDFSTTGEDISIALENLRKDIQNS